MGLWWQNCRPKRLDIAILIRSGSKSAVFAPTEVAVPGINIQRNSVLFLSNSCTASVLATPTNNPTF